MATNDWHDMLSALRGTMADDSDTDIDTTQASTATPPTQQGRLDIVFERKGRGGKTATIITGFTLPDDDIDALAAELKKRLGTGGSARGGEILIQGDRRQDVLRLLTERGFKARII